MSRTRKGPYRKSRRFDRSCRSHGGCPWCLSNKTHRHKKREVSMDEQERETTTEDGDANDLG